MTRIPLSKRYRLKKERKAIRDKVLSWIFGAIVLFLILKQIIH